MEFKIPLIENVCDSPGLREFSKVMLDMLTTLGGMKISLDIKCILMFVASSFPVLVICPEKSRELLISSESVCINKDVGLFGAESKPNIVTPTLDMEEFGSEDFSKNGFINSEFKKLGSLSPEDKKKVASEINNTKQELTKLFNDKSVNLAEVEIDERVKKEKDDVTLPEKDFTIGKIHPVSQVIDEISSIFSEIGFSVEEGPDVESEYYNFTALNTPENHPAKDMHDTFYIEENMKTLLRTHTSPVQVRTMLKGKPPFKIIAPGRTYRSDSDQTHTPMFHQLEGLHIDKNITMGHLKGCLNYFIKEFFEVDKIKMRFRPSHFPFTEPSAEVDIGYKIENNKIVIEICIQRSLQ